MLQLRSLLVMLSIAVGVECVAGDWESPENIRQAAEAFARKSLAAHEGVEVFAHPVDRRLQMPRCTVPLEASAARGFVGGQGTVTVSCGDAEPWRLFVPVRVSRMVTAVVARHALQRGQALTEDDLVLERRRSSSLPAAYLTRLEEVIGLKLRRALAAGEIVSPAALERPRIVRRGQLVTLVAEGSGLLVKSEGTAMQDAVMGERVRVRTRSGRIVEGLVAPGNQVSVGGR